jgi:hypothetical protein
MNRLSCHGWTLSQLIEEWEYYRDERLGILCGSAEPEPWMIRLAEQDADRAVQKLVKQKSEL